MLLFGNICEKAVCGQRSLHKPTDRPTEQQPPTRQRWRTRVEWQGLKLFCPGQRKTSLMEGMKAKLRTFAGTARAQTDFTHTHTHAHIYIYMQPEFRPWHFNRRPPPTKPSRSRSVDVIFGIGFAVAQMWCFLVPAAVANRNCLLHCSCQCRGVRSGKGVAASQSVMNNHRC